MRIKALFLDVDGTLTDGKIYMGESGEIFKAFCIKDGYGIHDILIPSGVVPVIITGRKSKIVENRCHELGITEIYQGITNKSEAVNSIMHKYNINIKEAAYIGDDVNDLEAMYTVKNKGGLVGCPNDASPMVKAISNYVCKNDGGKGAVREFIEWLVKDNNL